MIEINKKYRLRNGAQYRLYATDAGGEYPVHGCYYDRDTETWEVITHTSEGMFLRDKDEDDAGGFDLIEIKPYESYKIDQPVLVSINDSCTVYRRYFAGVHIQTGKPMAYPDGQTSWSATGAPLTWDNCILAEV